MAMGQEGDHPKHSPSSPLSSQPHMGPTGTTAGTYRAPSASPRLLWSPRRPPGPGGRCTQTSAHRPPAGAPRAAPALAGDPRPGPRHRHHAAAAAPRGGRQAPSGTKPTPGDPQAPGSAPGWVLGILWGERGAGVIRVGGVAVGFGVLGWSAHGGGGLGVAGGRGQWWGAPWDWGVDFGSLKSWNH